MKNRPPAYWLYEMGCNRKELPMWVADMDFQTAPQITEAIIKRAQHGVFGYTLIEDEWYDAYQNWWKTRHEWSIEKEWLIFCTGVVPAISSIVRKMTTTAEKVVVMTPVYNIFFNSIINNGRFILESLRITKMVPMKLISQTLRKNFQTHRHPY